MRLPAPTKLLKLNIDANRPNRYVALLICVVAMTTVAPLVDHQLWTRVLFDCFALLSLLTACLAVETTRSKLTALFVLAGIGCLMWCGSFWNHIYPFGTDAYEIACYGVMLVFFAVVCGIMLRDVYTGDVTANDICGAICVYLLLGFCFAIIHLMIFVADSSAYKDSSTANPDAVSSLPIARRHMYPTFVYYSFCTMSTVGYGDITPVGRVARTMSWLEAVAGQIYLTVLVARLVGLQIANATNSKNDGGKSLKES
jgi:hypothetical protein